MASGTPLNDDDRYPWLAALHDLLLAHAEKGETAVVACSALKKKYRDQLRHGNDNLRFVYLEGDFDLIWQRMQARPNHYMKAEMLQSQFDTLEPPTPEDACIISIENDVESIVAAVR